MNASATRSTSISRRQEIVLSRVFDAPRRLVFNALTLPEMLGYWFGPADASLEVCEVELRRGGAFRYVWRTADGRETQMSGTFLEIAAPGRIVARERFEEAGRRAEFLSTTELSEADGLTTLRRTIRAVSATVERDPAPAYDRLAELFEPSLSC